MAETPISVTKVLAAINERLVAGDNDGSGEIIVSIPQKTASRWLHQAGKDRKAGKDTEYTQFNDAVTGFTPQAP
jgi:hypothetical protein